MMLVLGLDTSCYTTSIALLDEDGVLIASERRLLTVPVGGRGLRQQEMVYQHTVALPELFSRGMDKVPKDSRIVAVAASARPRNVSGSYMPAFLVGSGYGQSIARACGASYFETDHQSGHVAAALCESGFPDCEDFMALHLSGGTTELLRVTQGRIALIGGTHDSSFGQLVDRTGVALGLAFPAGPALEELAANGTDRNLIGVSAKGIGCSVSGAEAAASRLIAAGEAPADVAMEIYSFLVRTTARLLEAAKEETDLNIALLAGGVASSARFRNMLTDRLTKRRIGVTAHFAKPEYSGDNAVGVARIAWERWKAEAAD